MRDDVKTAAERCRDFSGPGWVDVENASPACVADLLTLARAYLTEHPADDGEPVTGEWLQSVGFDPARNPDWLWLEWGGSDLHRLMIPPGGAKPIFERDMRSVFLPDQPTRGDVRRLLVALGVTTTEG